MGLGVVRAIIQIGLSAESQSGGIDASIDSVFRFRGAIERAINQFSDGVKTGSSCNWIPV